MRDFTIDIERKLNRLGKDFQRMVERCAPEEDEYHDFRPVSDILESDNTYKIIMDIPGLAKKEINISLKNYVLTVRGERVDESNESEIYRKRERTAGVFSRSFALPKNAVAEDLSATFRNGVLTILMPKLDDHEDSTDIPIK